MYTISDAINLSGFAIAIVLSINLLPAPEPIKSAIEMVAALLVGYAYYRGKKLKS